MQPRRFNFLNVTSAQNTYLQSVTFINSYCLVLTHFTIVVSQTNPDSGQGRVFLNRKYINLLGRSVSVSIWDKTDITMVLLFLDCWRQTEVVYALNNSLDCWSIYRADCSPYEITLTRRACSMFYQRVNYLNFGPVSANFMPLSRSPIVVQFYLQHNHFYYKLFSFSQSGGAASFPVIPR